MSSSRLATGACGTSRATTLARPSLPCASSSLIRRSEPIRSASDLTISSGHCDLGRMPERQAPSPRKLPSNGSAAADFRGLGCGSGRVVDTRDLPRVRLEIIKGQPRWRRLALLLQPDGHVALHDDFLLAGGGDNAQDARLDTLVAHQLDDHRDLAIGGRDRVAEAKAVEWVRGIEAAV